MDDKLPVTQEMSGGESCFAHRVKGDSIIEAYIIEGDLAIIRPQVQVKNDSIEAVMVEDLPPFGHHNHLLRQQVVEATRPLEKLSELITGITCTA